MGFSRNAWLYPWYKLIDTWTVNYLISILESEASLTIYYKRQVLGAVFTEKVYSRGCILLAGVKHILYVLAGEMYWMCVAASWETELLRHYIDTWWCHQAEGVSHLHHRPIPIITVTADLFVVVEYVAEVIFRQMVEAERRMSTAVESPTVCKKCAGNTLIPDCGHLWINNYNVFACNDPIFYRLFNLWCH